MACACVSPERLAPRSRVRAERRAGELLAEMPLLNGARGIGKKVESHGTIPLLSDLGISRDQSSRWQKLAAVPEDKFEQAVGAGRSRELLRRKGSRYRQWVRRLLRPK